MQEPPPRRIQVNVVSSDAKVTAVGSAFAGDGNGFVASLEHMTPALMPRIPPLAKCAHQIAHPIDKIRLGCF